MSVFKELQPCARDLLVQNLLVDRCRSTVVAASADTDREAEAWQPIVRIMGHTRCGSLVLWSPLTRWRATASPCRNAPQIIPQMTQAFLESCLEADDALSLQGPQGPWKPFGISYGARLRIF